MRISDTNLLEPGEEDEDTVVRANRMLVMYVTGRTDSYLPYWTKSDIFSWGLEGLLEATRKWDPLNERAKWSTFALAHIRWAIMDGKRTWGPKRREQNNLPIFFESLDRLRELDGQGNNPMHDEYSKATAYEDSGFESVEVEDAVSRIKLTAKERVIMQRRRKELTLAEVGEGMGVSESRICQVVRRRIAPKIKEALGG
jgi:RNA polymerase sigma factor (sigma-70 family)